MKFILPLLVVASVGVLQMRANPMIIAFEGEITRFTADNFLPGVSVGDPFTVRVVYDLTPTSGGGSGTYVNNVFVPAAQQGYWWFGEGYTMSVSVGSYEIVTADNTTLAVANNLTRSGSSNSYYSGFSFSTAHSVQSGGFYSGIGTGGSISVGLGSLQTGPIVYPAFPDTSVDNVVEYPVSDFNVNEFRIHGWFNGVNADVWGEVGSYSISSVPEPSSFMTATALVLVGAGAWLRRRRRHV